MCHPNILNVYIYIYEHARAEALNRFYNGARIYDSANGEKFLNLYNDHGDTGGVIRRAKLRQGQTELMRPLPRAIGRANKMEWANHALALCLRALLSRLTHR